MPKPTLFPVRSLSATAVLLAFPALVFAQGAANQTVTITGSNIKRVDAEGVSAVQVVSREEIERSSAATLGDFARSLAINSAGSTNESAVNNQSGGAGISLRGLGQKSTLVLVNGRRVANHAIAQGADTFVDINSIPKAAVERIEVLKEGASAIYGSDAIAGVVNFILRKDYRGISLAASGGRSTEGGLGERSASLAVGFGDLGEKGYNVLAVLDIFQRDRLLLSERQTVGEGDFRGRPGGGLPWLSSSGGSWVLSPPVSGAARAPLDPCQGPSTPQPGNLFFSTGTVCGFTTTPYITAFPQADRASLLTRGTLSLSPSTSLFAELSYAANGSKWINQPQQFTNATTVLNPATGAPRTFSAFIPANNPSNPFGRPTQLRYTFFDVGPRAIDLKTDTYRALAGGSGTLADWDWEAAVGNSESKIREITRNQVDAFKLTEVINNGSYNFRAPTAAQTDNLRFSTTRNAKSELSFADLKASTQLAKLPGGPLSLALGADGRRETMSEMPDPAVVAGRILGTGAGRVDGSRTVTAAFAELSVPITKQLELQAAVRADHYSDFGNAATPKLALKWTPTGELLLRASWNQGFRAPTLVENAQSTATGFVNVRDPRRANATTLVSGIFTGNPNLSPEKSDAFTIGLVAEPMKNLSVGIDFYDIAQKNLVANNGFQYVVNNETLFPGAVLRDAAGVILSVADAYTNVSKVETKGLDVDFKLIMPAGNLGRVTARGNVSYIISWKQPAALGQPLTEFVGVNNSPDGALPRTRANFALDWDLGNFTSTLRVNHTGNYRQGSTTTPGAPPKIDSHETFDLYLGWRAMKTVKLYASVQNLKDAQPPWDPTQPLGFSLTQFDMRGRFVRAGLEVQF